MEEADYDRAPVAVEIRDAKVASCEGYGTLSDAERRRRRQPSWIRVAALVITVLGIVLVNVWSQCALKPSLRASEFGKRRDAARSVPGARSVPARGPRAP